MFLIDDIICFPARGLLAIFREIENAARQEFDSEADAIRSSLSELYMMLETGTITSAEFDAREKELLDRLDAVESAGGKAGKKAPEEAGEQAFVTEWGTD